MTCNVALALYIDLLIKHNSAVQAALQHATTNLPWRPGTFYLARRNAGKGGALHWCDATGQSKSLLLGPVQCTVLKALAQSQAGQVVRILDIEGFSAKTKDTAKHELMRKLLILLRENGLGDIVRVHGNGGYSLRVKIPIQDDPPTELGAAQQSALARAYALAADPFRAAVAQAALEQRSDLVVLVPCTNGGGGIVYGMQGAKVCTLSLEDSPGQFQVLMMLAQQGGRATRLIDIFPEQEEESVRMTLYRLRDALADAGLPVVRSAGWGHGYCLSCEALIVEVPTNGPAYMGP